VTKRRRASSRAIPLAYDDSVRAGIPLALGVLGLAIVLVVLATTGSSSRALVAAAGCATLILALGVYLVWTHVLYTNTDPATLARIAAAQHQRRPSALARVFGLSSTENWAISVAVAALAGAIAAAVFGTQEGGLLLAILALGTAVAAWVTVVYAFALRYFRLHAAGEHFTIDITEEPRFEDFITTALMISSAGALSAGAPTTRASLGAVRAHTVIAFGFNALVIAMAVSLMTSFVTTLGTS
jgi:uncharacterized membrane protein